MGPEKTEETEKEAEETTEETTEEEAADGEETAAEGADAKDDTREILEDIRETIKNKPEEKKPPVEDHRERWKKDFGFDDKQVDGAQKIALETMAQFQKAERTMWADLAKKFPDITEFRDAIEEELSEDGYTPQHRVNPSLVEKVYWMRKGKSMSTTKKPEPVKKAADTKVVSRKIATGFPERETSMGKGDEGSEVTLTEEEKQYTTMFDNVTERDYETSKKSRKFIKPFEPKPAGIPQNANPADLALHNMRRKRGRL